MCIIMVATAEVKERGRTLGHEGAECGQPMDLEGQVSAIRERGS